MSCIQISSQNGRRGNCAKYIQVRVQLIKSVQAESRTSTLQSSICIVPARLSVHTEWISCMILAQFPRLPFFALIYTLTLRSKLLKPCPNSQKFHELTTYRKQIVSRLFFLLLTSWQSCSSFQSERAKASWSATRLCSRIKSWCTRFRLGCSFTRPSPASICTV